MLDRHFEALDLYARLVTHGVDAIAADPCGEGRAKARGVVSDAHYRASISLNAIGNDKASVSALEQCLDLRGPGCRSIYKLTELGASAAEGRHGKVQTTSRARSIRGKSTKRGRSARG